MTSGSCRRLTDPLRRLRGEEFASMCTSWRDLLLHTSNGIVQVQTALLRRQKDVKNCDDKDQIAQKVAS